MWFWEGIIILVQSVAQKLQSLQDKLGLSCVKLRPASLLSGLLLVHSELYKSEVNKVNKYQVLKGAIIKTSTKFVHRCVSLYKVKIC